jgi:hypothetical protein
MPGRDQSDFAWRSSINRCMGGMVDFQGRAV